MGFKQKHVYNLSPKKLELDMYHLIVYFCSLEIKAKKNHFLEDILEYLLE